MAFGLPAARKTFPNRAISLYHALRSFQYGELATPLHPDLSVLGAAANTVATHRFTVSNPGGEVANVVLSTLGGAWQRALTPTSMRLDPGESRVATVAVTVPTAQSLGSANASDRGFLQLSGAGGAALTSVAFETRVGASEPPRRRLRWEYWNGRGWSRLIAADGTDRLSRTGLIEFLGPADLTLSRQFGVDGYWVRALLEPGDQPLVPRVRALAPNTTMASQLVTLRAEVLGSSDASENQQFRTIRTPVLLGQQLEVREPGPLADDEVAQLTAVHGKDAVTAAGTNNEFWVRWTEVPDLHGAGPLDRHYVLDHLSGQVSFGDGVQGRIPPRGVGNLRLARYQTGGGQRGNCAAGSIVQMKTTVPYVDRVTNIDAAASGFDAESTTALVTRAPRTLRHGGRAVAADDYEDLARLASAEVARARCVPLRRLREDPLGSRAGGRGAQPHHRAGQQRSKAAAFARAARAHRRILAHATGGECRHLAGRAALRARRRGHGSGAGDDRERQRSGAGDPGAARGVPAPIERRARRRRLGLRPQAATVGPARRHQRRCRRGSPAHAQHVAPRGSRRRRSHRPFPRLLRPAPDRLHVCRERMTMALTLPELDDRTFDDLTEEARSLLVTYAPALTNHNASDPLVTLTELFAYLTDVMLFRLNTVTDANRTAFLRLLNGPDWQAPTDHAGLDAEVRRSVNLLRTFGSRRDCRGL